MARKKAGRERFFKRIAADMVNDEHYLSSNFDPAEKFARYFSNMKLDEIKAVLDERDRLEKIKERSPK